VSQEAAPGSPARRGDADYCQAEWDHAVATAKAELAELLETPTGSWNHAREKTMLFLIIEILRDELIAWAKAA
jgi:hypothetical protein